MDGVGAENSSSTLVFNNTKPNEGTWTVEFLLKIYFTPLLLFAGTFGNLLSLVVFSRQKFRQSPTAFYFRVLAIADTLVLYVGLWPNWLRDAFDVHVFPITDAACGALVYLKYLLSDCAVWVLVLMTVERYIDVIRPHTAQRLFTWRRLWASVLLTILTLAVVNLPSAWIAIAAQDRTIHPCAVGNHQLGYLIWPCVDLALYCLLPFLIMLTCNVAIIRNIVNMQHACGRHGNRHDETTTLTIMLLTVTFGFLLLTSPFAVYAITVYHFQTVAPRAYLLFYFIASYLRYVNHVINFPLYCLSGKIFRKELKQMCCGGNDPDPETSLYQSVEAEVIHLN